MAKYRISECKLVDLACEAGLPTIEVLRERIDGRIVWELALPDDPEGLHGDHVIGKINLTIVRHAGGFELTSGTRVLRVGRTQAELQTALQCLAGLRPNAIEGGAAPPLAT